MVTVKLETEFMHGIIWTCDKDGIDSPFPLVDDDEILMKLNNETEDLFNENYEFDSHDMPCYFNRETEKKNKDRMLYLIVKIKERLAEINDGSFVVKDYVTDYYKNL